MPPIDPAPVARQSAPPITKHGALRLSVYEAAQGLVPDLARNSVQAPVWGNAPRTPLRALVSRDALLLLRDLALSRGEAVLFEGLDFSLHSGQLVQLRGVNGAAKRACCAAWPGCWHR